MRASIRRSDLRLQAPQDECGMRCIGALLILGTLSGMFAGPVVDDEFERLCAEFVAPCCWRESLSTHRSPEAEEIRDEVRGLLAAGRSVDEIRETLVGRYGAAILITPDGARGAWLFVIPILMCMLGLAAGAWALSRWRRLPRRVAATTSPVPDSEWEW